MDVKTMLEALDKINLDPAMHLIYGNRFDAPAMRRKLLNNKEFKLQDVLKMIQFYFMGGTNLSNIRAKSNVSDQAALDELITRYDLKSKVKNATTYNVVTLARVAAAFPEYSVGFLQEIDKDEIDRPVSVSSMEADLKVSSYPLLLTTKVLLCCIPCTGTFLDKESVNKLFNILLYYSANETPILDKERLSKSFKENYLWNIEYCTKSLKSRILKEGEEGRYEVCKNLTTIFEDDGSSLTLKDDIVLIYDAVVRRIGEIDSSISPFEAV